MKSATLVLPLAALALPAAAVAQSARPCISTAENEAVVGYILPSLVTKLSARCAAAAPYLRGNGARIAATLQPNSEASWATARAAAERVGGRAIPSDGAAGAIARAALGPALADGIAGGFDPANCATVDRLMTQLAPLPARNLAAVLALFLELGIAENDRVPYRVCR